MRKLAMSCNNSISAKNSKCREIPNRLESIHFEAGKAFANGVYFGNVIYSDGHIIQVQCKSENRFLDGQIITIKCAE